MNKALKKVIAIAMAAVSMSVGAISTTASAANTGNTYITSFSVPNASMDWRKYTGSDCFRSKTDYTPVYFYPYSGTVSLNVRTYGCYSSSLGANKTMNGSAVYVDSVFCNIGYEYAIRSGIKESGYNYAGLELRTTSSYSGTTLSAAWSPDSVWTSGMSYAN